MNHDNKTFCVLPFIHKHTRLSNQDTLCCNSHIAVGPDDINIIRQKLLNGEKIKHCDTCYVYEDQGIISPRMKENERWLDDTEVKNYIETYNITLPETSRLMTSSFSKYNSNIDTMGNELTMQYHTDYIISEKDMPGPKFFLTCTTYINDDYEGGDIEFYMNDQFYPHKPKAGDILVFPSTDPYYHGVRTIRNGEKFFIRNFIQYSYDGSPEWLEQQKYHGAYRWAKMEVERIEKENKQNMKYAPRKNLGYM